MRRLDEELRLFDALVRRLEGRPLERLFVGVEEVVRELRPGERIVEETGVVEARLELADDLRGVVADVDVLDLGHRLRRLQHRAQRLGRGRLRLAALEVVERLERDALARRQTELDQRHHLAGAFADADVADGVLARIAPVRVVGAIVGVGGNASEVLEQLAHASLADASDEGLEALALLALADVQAAQPLDRVGDRLRRHRESGQSIGRGVSLGLPAQDDLEVRHRAIADLAAHPVEADVGDVVLAARVEAARDLDLEVLDRVVELEVASLDAAPQLGGEPARRRDAELAGVGAGQAVMSTRVEAPGSARPAAARSPWSATRSRSAIQRRTKFWSTVVRRWPSLYLRAIAASARSWREVMSPSGRQTTAIT